MARDRILRPRVAKVDAGTDAMALSDYMLKARGVRATIFAPESVPAEKQESFEANGQSHFMRLPPELRNRIYSLCLCTGSKIHVSGPSSNSNMRLTLKRKLTRSICKLHEHNEEDSTSFQQDPFHFRHHNCFVEKSEAFNFSILQTSRQIHSEAALLFYQENTFTFGDILDLEAFVSFLIPAQVKAVQSIEFVYHYFRSNETFEKFLQSKLGSLNSLIIHLEGNMRGIDPASPVFECLSRFQRLSIKSAIVKSDTLEATLKKGIEEKLEGDWNEQREEKPKKKGAKNTAEQNPKQATKKGVKKG